MNREAMGRVVNLAMFYLGWFACVGAAAQGRLWLGPAVAAGLLCIHLASTPAPAREGRLILLAGLFGFAVDTAQATVGLFAFTNTSVASWLSPPWMVALWMLFATTLNSSLGWLAGRHGLAAALGAIGGPVSYLAGARLGAIELPDHQLESLVGIAATWAVAMPTLLGIRDLLSRSPAESARLHPAAGRGSSAVIPGCVLEDARPEESGA